MNTYLLEIGLEEVPASLILPTIDQLYRHAEQFCKKYRFSQAQINTFSTPRRLAVQIQNLPDVQEEQIVELKGPPLHIAQDTNQAWTQAAKGFAKKNNVTLQEFRNTHS